jgi:hypothetical protein
MTPECREAGAAAGAGRESLRDAARDGLTPQSLAQVILSGCPEGARYSEFLDGVFPGRWPEAVEDAVAVIVRATGIDPRTDTKGYTRGLPGSR